MPIDVGAASLRASYLEHRKSADKLGQGVSACLLRVYAVECGLKAALMRRQKIRDTSELDRTHDLRALAKRLRLPPGQVAHLRRDPVLKSDANRKVHPSELHEVWRYGAALGDGDQKKMEELLGRLLEWLEGELGR
jgi:HEPN domain-containing protein